jgi:hypothetical protein
MRFNGDETPQQGDADRVSLSDLSGDHCRHAQPF